MDCHTVFRASDRDGNGGNELSIPNAARMIFVSCEYSDVARLGYPFARLVVMNGYISDKRAQPVLGLLEQFRIVRKSFLRK